MDTHGIVKAYRGHVTSPPALETYPPHAPFLEPIRSELGRMSNLPILNLYLTGLTVDAASSGRTQETDGYFQFVDYTKWEVFLKLK